MRKRNRLQGYDYSRQGAYFITVCTQNRAELFGHIVGANCVRPFTNDGRPQVAPTVSRIITQWKGSITKRLGFSPWQKSFHDHVIRNQDDYLRIAQYIENNPAQWQMDSLHPSKISRKKQEPE